MSATRSATSSLPGENVHHMFHEDAPALKRAGFIAHHLWVTQYSPREQYAAGDYPYQSRGGAGLPEYVQQDRPLQDAGRRRLVHVRRPPRGSS